MQKFTTLTAAVVPLDRANVDTDAIIPKQFMKSIRRTGFGDNLFDAWRYLDRGEPGQDASQRPQNPDFPLNQMRFANAQILLTRGNFGCGSSREHAPWALRDWGIRVLIAPSFADIFYGNCFKNGLLPIALPELTIQHFFDRIQAGSTLSLHINLSEQTVTCYGDTAVHFDIEPGPKHRLLNGLDEIGMTLDRATAIRAYELQRRETEPWLFRLCPDR